MLHQTTSNCQNEKPTIVQFYSFGDGGVMVWGMISWLTLDPLILVKHSLNFTANLSTIADCTCAFMATSYHLMVVSSSMIKCHIKKCKSQTDSTNMTICSVYITGFPNTRSEVKEFHGIADKSAAIM